MKITRTQLKYLIENLMHEDVILDDEGKPAKYKSQNQNFSNQKKLGIAADMSKSRETLKYDITSKKEIRTAIAGNIPLSQWKGSKMQRGKSIALSGSKANKNKLFQKEIGEYLTDHGFKSEDDIVAISLSKLKDYFKYIKNSNFKLFEDSDSAIAKMEKTKELKDRGIILVFGKSQDAKSESIHDSGLGAAAEAARLDAMKKIDAKFGGPFKGKASKILKKDHLHSLGLAAPINFIYGQDKKGERKGEYMFAGVYAIPTTYLFVQIWEKVRPDLMNKKPVKQIYDPKSMV